MVGALGETELAAVTMANSVFYVLSLIIFGIQSGTGVLVAQYYGKGRLDAINRIMGMGYYVSLGLTALIALLEPGKQPKAKKEREAIASLSFRSHAQHLFEALGPSGVTRPPCDPSGRDPDQGR